MRTALRRSLGRCSVLRIRIAVLRVVKQENSFDKPQHPDNGKIIRTNKTHIDDEDDKNDKAYTLVCKKQVHHDRTSPLRDDCGLHIPHNLQ